MTREGFVLQTLYWQDNILFCANGVSYGVYRLPALPYENQPEAIKRSMYRQLEVFFQSYRGEGQLISIAVPLPPDEVAARMAGYSSHPHWRGHMELVAERLRTTPSFERITCLILPLVSAYEVAWSAVLDRPDRIGERLMDQVRRFWGYTKRKVFRAQGTPVLTQAEIQAAVQAEVRMFNLLQALIPTLMRATPTDIELLHRAPYFRGLSPWPASLSNPLPKTVTVEDGEVVIRPHPLRLALGSATVREDTFRIRVEHDDKRVSYQSVMAVSSMPERMETLGDEWLYLPLERCPFLSMRACIFHIPAMAGILQGPGWDLSPVDEAVGRGAVLQRHAGPELLERLAVCAEGLLRGDGAADSAGPGVGVPLHRLVHGDL
jgi:hypothetical protein